MTVASPLTDKTNAAWYQYASASLLAEAPAEPTNDNTRPDPAWETVRGHLESRLTMLQAWRLSWWDHWGLLASYILPRRYTWLSGGSGPTPNTMVRGVPINQNIVDPTGTQAMRICASGLMSGLTSPSRPWFKLKVGLPGFTPDSAAQAWLDTVERRLYAIMARSNFYDALAQMFEDLATFGTAPVIIYEDTTDVIRCYNPCAGEYYLAVSSAFRPESFYRKFVLTTAQIVEMFGIENCPPDIVEMWRTKGASLENERIVAHAIEPNFPLADRTGASVDTVDRKYAYREVYWVWGLSGAHALSVRGFEDLPLIAPRWAVTANDAYGRSVAMDVLPDIMQLQQETKRKAEAIEKQVRPPLLADAQLKEMPSSQLPGHVTYVQNLGAATGMRPIYEVNPDLSAMREDLKEIQARIKTGFFNDLFLMLTEMEGVQPRNELEITERRSEKMQVLGPVIERFQNEGAALAIHRVYRVAAKKGLLPAPPKSLHGVPLDLEFVSMMALAQRAAATTAMEGYASMIGRMAAVKPEMVDMVDGDEFAREYADLLNLPPRVVPDPAKIAQIRAARAKQQQAQQNMQQGLAMAQGAQTLSQTPIGQGSNALDAILGLGAGPGR